MFFNNKKEQIDEVVTEVITTEVENPEIPTIGYSEVIEELDLKVEEPKVEELKTGKVTGCTKLNVRKKADKDADVLAIIDCNKEVTVNLSDSTEEFYKICTPAGIEGYCMKKFVDARL